MHLLGWRSDSQRKSARIDSQKTLIFIMLARVAKIRVQLGNPRASRAINVNLHFPLLCSCIGGSVQGAATRYEGVKSNIDWLLFCSEV